MPEHNLAVLSLGGSAADSDLETVKKGSALYGQPEWWGDDSERSNQANQPDTVTTGG